MSEMLPVWYTTQWRNTTIHKYQQRGFLLRPFVMPPHEVMGEKLVFRLLDKMSAERDVGRGETVKENNPTMSKVELDTKKTRVGFLVDEDDLDLTNLGPAVIDAHATSAAMEMGRVHDSIIIDEMEAGAGEEIGDYTTPTTPDRLMLGRQRLHANHVPTQDGQVFAAISSISWNACMDFKQFANADWTGPDNLPFVRGGMAKTWNGINIFVPDDDVLYRADKIGQPTQMHEFMWHKSAFGFGSLYNPPMRASGQWKEERSAWLHTLRHRYGAKTLQSAGIIRMRTDYDTEHIVATK